MNKQSHLIGDLSHLLQYETERQRATAPMVAGIHGINAIFSEQFPPFQLARNLGLSVLNSLPPIKVRYMLFYKHNAYQQ